MQPDTIVPDPSNPQSLNRYTYTFNHPLCYVDPDGHFPLAISLILIAAGAAGIIDWSVQVHNNTKEGLNFWQAVDHLNIDEGRALKTAAAAGAGTALVVTAGPALASIAGQGLMGAGMATGSTAMWTAGTTTLAAGATLQTTLWAQPETLPKLSHLQGGTYAHSQLEEQYLAGTPMNQRSYVDADRSFRNSVTGKLMRPDIINHWTGEVVEYKPMSWNDSGMYTRRSTSQLNGYVEMLNQTYGDWRSLEGLPDYWGRLEFYNRADYYIPE